MCTNMPGDGTQDPVNKMGAIALVQGQKHLLDHLEAFAVSSNEEEEERELVSGSLRLKSNVSF